MCLYTKLRSHLRDHRRYIKWPCRESWIKFLSSILTLKGVDWISKHVVSRSEKKIAMSVSVFYNFICACLRRCRSFNTNLRCRNFICLWCRCFPRRDAFRRSTWRFYTCKLFLMSQMRQIFVLSWSGFSQRLPKNSDDFPKTSEHCRNVWRCSNGEWALPKLFGNASVSMIWHS